MIDHLPPLLPILLSPLLAGCYLGYERLSKVDRSAGSSVGILWFFLLPLNIPRFPFWLAVAFGIVFAFSYAGWMLWKLRLAVPVSLLLACSQTLVWTLFAVGSWKLWALPFPLNCALIASWGTALFWLEWTLLPLWGTAQNPACSNPINPPFIAILGTAGGTWSWLFLGVVTGVILISIDDAFKKGHPEQLFASGGLLLGGMALSAILDALFLRQPPPRILRVATFGWAGPEFNGLTEIPAQYQNAAREANERGARLLVTPEAAIQVQDRTSFRVAIGTLAQKYNLALAIGYFDQKQNENCIDFVSAQGEVVGRYVKTHLVPVFENYTRGLGGIALMDVDGVKVGGVICQDDNFPDIARKYARAGVQLLVVPTHDWKNVKDIHFANHLWRGLEFRFALARAASGGISAVTSAAGRIQKSSDHFRDGTRLLVADVQVGNGKPTPYARIGDWFPIACGLAALAGIITAR